MPASPTTPGTSRADRIHDHQRRQFAARQHVVADRQLLGRQIARAPARRPLRSGRTGSPCDPARSSRSARRMREPLAVAATSGSRRAGAAARRPGCASTARKQRLRLQHHARPAAKRHIVHDPVPVGREIAQIVHADIQHARRRSRAPMMPSASPPSTIFGKIVTMSIFTACVLTGRFEIQSIPPADRR